MSASEVLRFLHAEPPRILAPPPDVLSPRMVRVIDRPGTSLKWELATAASSRSAAQADRYSGILPCLKRKRYRIPRLTFLLSQALFRCGPSGRPSTWRTVSTEQFTQGGISEQDRVAFSLIG